MLRTIFLTISLLGLLLPGTLLLATEGDRQTNFMDTTPSSEQLIEALQPETAASQEASQSEASDGKPRMRYRALSVTQRKPAKVLLNIPFEFDSDKLTPEAVTTLEALGTALNSRKLAGQTFAVQGHTDSKGSFQYNQALSEKRAQAVVEHLVTRHGIARNRLQAEGKGEMEPFDPLEPEAGVNRRVEIINTSE